MKRSRLLSRLTGPVLLMAAVVLLSPGSPATARTPSARAAASPIGAELHLGVIMNPGDAIISPSGRYALSMSPNGVLSYRQAPNRLNPSPVVRPLAQGPAGSILQLQYDGNLVMYAPGGAVVRSFGTLGRGAVVLAIQDDGNLVLYGDGGQVVLDFGFADDGVLLPGEVLLPGDTLRLRGSATTLAMQGDGNLVLYVAGVALFSTRTAGFPGAATILQSDGNVVVYSAGTAPRALFATATAGAGVELDLSASEFTVLRFQGDLVPTALFGSSWGSATVSAGQLLRPGDRRVSADGACTLVLQTDGNLVDYCAGRPVFQSGSRGQVLGTMSADGNFRVVQDPLGAATTVFQTGTGRYAGSRLTVQGDGNLVVYTPQNRPVFSLR